MNPKGMLRRTLALLLVLVFALSNMGLAEMADAVADSIPAQEPQIEEIAEEAAPVEEQAEEAAPAEETAPAEEAPAEDEASDEADAPADETAPAEDEAPAADAPVVQVAVMALDEQSLFADVEGAEYEGALAYQWEIASTDENGETVWTAIEGATDAIYAGDAADMAGQTYRCVVTAGDVTVASEGIVSDPAIFGVEVAALGMDDTVELAALDNPGEFTFMGDATMYTPNVTGPAVSDGINGTTTVIFAGGDLSAEEGKTITLTASVTWPKDAATHAEGGVGRAPETGDTVWFGWDLGELARWLTLADETGNNKLVAFDDGSENLTADYASATDVQNVQSDQDVTVTGTLELKIKNRDLAGWLDGETARSVAAATIRVRAGKQSSDVKAMKFTTPTKDYSSVGKSEAIYVTALDKLPAETDVGVKFYKLTQPVEDNDDDEPSAKATESEQPVNAATLIVGSPYQQVIAHVVVNGEKAPQYDGLITLTAEETDAQQKSVKALVQIKGTTAQGLPTMAAEGAGATALKNLDISTQKQVKLKATLNTKALGLTDKTVEPELPLTLTVKPTFEIKDADGSKAISDTTCDSYRHSHFGGAKYPVVAAVGKSSTVTAKAVETDSQSGVAFNDGAAGRKWVVTWPDDGKMDNSGVELTPTGSDTDNVSLSLAVSNPKNFSCQKAYMPTISYVDPYLGTLASMHVDVQAARESENFGIRLNTMNWDDYQMGEPSVKLNLIGAADQDYTFTADIVGKSNWEDITKTGLLTGKQVSWTIKQNGAKASSGTSLLLIGDSQNDVEQTTAAGTGRITIKVKNAANHTWTSADGENYTIEASIPDGKGSGEALVVSQDVTVLPNAKSAEVYVRVGAGEDARDVPITTGSEFIPPFVFDVDAGQVDIPVGITLKSGKTVNNEENGAAVAAYGYVWLTGNLYGGGDDAVIGYAVMQPNGDAEWHLTAKTPTTDGTYRKSAVEPGKYKLTPHATLPNSSAFAPKEASSVGGTLQAFDVFVMQPLTGDLTLTATGAALNKDHEVMQPTASSANDIALELAATDADAAILAAYQSAGAIDWHVYDYTGDVTEINVANGDEYLTTSTLTHANADDKVSVKAKASQEALETGKIYQIDAVVGNQKASYKFTILPAADTLTTEFFASQTDTKAIEFGSDPLPTETGHTFKITNALSLAGAPDQKVWENGYTISVKKKGDKGTYETGATETKENVAGEYTWNATDGLLTFDKAGDYQVQFTADGYTQDTVGSVLGGTPRTFSVKDLPKPETLELASTDGTETATPKSTLVGAGDSVTVKFTEPAAANYYMEGAEYSWELVGNSYGTYGQNHYVMAVKPATLEGGQDTETADISQLGQAKSVKLVVPKGITQSTTNKAADDDKLAIRLTLTLDGIAEPVVAEQELTVIAGAAEGKQPSAASDFVYDAIVPQAIGQDADAEKFTIKLNDSFNGMPVKFEVDSSDSTLVTCNDMDETDDEAEFTVTSLTDGQENTVYKATDGRTVTINATVTYGYDATEGKPLTSETPIAIKIKVRPRAKSVVIKQKVAKTGTQTTYDYNAISANPFVAQSSATNMTLVAEGVGPKITVDGKDAFVIAYTDGDTTWDVKQLESTSADGTENFAIIEPSVTKGELSLPISAATQYQVTAHVGGVSSDTDAVEEGAQCNTIKIMVPPTKIDYTYNDTKDQTYIYAPTKNGQDESVLVVKAVLTGSDGSPAYTGNLTWTGATNVTAASGIKLYAGDYNTDAATEIVYETDKASQGLAGVKTPDLKGVDTISIVVTGAYNYDAADAVKRITLAPSTTNANGNRLSGTTVSIEIRNTPTNPFEAKIAEGETVMAFDDSDAIIAQGKNTNVKFASAVRTAMSSMKVEYSVALATAEDLTAAQFSDKSNVSITSASGATDAEKKAALEKWITVSSTGLVSAKALETGDNPANKITNETGAKFKVTATIVGTTFSQSAIITVLPQAVGAKVVVAKADGTEDTGTELPKALSSNMELIVKGVPVGPKYDDVQIDAVPENVTLRFTPSPTTAIKREDLKDEDGKANGATKITVQSLTTPSKTGGLTIQATLSSDPKVTSEETSILLVDETVTVTTGNATCTDGGAHKWVLAEGAQTDAKGHKYVCSVCTAEGYAPHSAFTIVKCEAHKKSTDEYHYILGGMKGCTADKPCQIVCAVCDYECKHTNYPTKDATWIDSTYHEAKCPDCEQLIYQEHVDIDKDNVCDVCGESNAKITFKKTGATGAVTAITEDTMLEGAEETYDIAVENAYTWTTKWSTADTEYIDVDEDSGKVTAQKMTKKDAPAKLKAEITVTTIVNGDKVNKTISAELPITVAAAPTSVAVKAEGTRNYVLEGDTADANYIKLVVDTGIDTPDLSGYTWTVKSTKDEKGKPIDNPAQYFEFHEVDKPEGKPEKYKEAEFVLDNQKNMAEIPTELYVTAKSTNGKDTLKGRLLISFEKEFEPGDPKPEITAQPLDYYDALSGQVIENALTFDKQPETGEMNIAQGDTFKVFLDPAKFDESVYGKPVFTISAAADATMTDFQVSKWVTLKDGVVTVLPAGLNNDLTKETGTKKQFKITATVTPKNADGTDNTEGNAVWSKTFTVVEQPKQIVLQYEKSTDTWETLTSANAVSLMPGESVTLKAVPVDEKGAPISGSIGDGSFTWNFDQYDESVLTVNKTDDGKPDPNAVAGEYNICVKDGAVAVSPITITAKAAYSTKATASTSITVLPKIESITLSAQDDLTEYAIGEYTETADGRKEKQVVITATTTPANAGEEFEWKLACYNMDGTEMAAQVSGAELQQVKTGDNTVMKLIPGDAGCKFVITATTKRNATDAEGKPIAETVSNSITATVYKEADGENALLFDTENSDQNLTVGEKVLLKTMEYNKDGGYGSTIPLAAPVAVKQTPSDSEAAADTKVVDVVPNDDGTYSVEALVPGEAEVELRAYNYDASSNVAPARKLTFRVYPEVFSITATGLKEKYEIYVGQTPAETIPVSAFQAMYMDASGIELEANEANIVLVSDDPSVLTVKKNASNDWELTGVSGGNAKINVMVGSKSFDDVAIDVTVQSAPQDIVFSVDDVAETRTQVPLTVSTEESAAIKVTAAKSPADAHGDVTIEIASDEAGNATKNEDGSVTVKPAKAGVTTISAKIQKDYTAGTDSINDQKYLIKSIDIVVTEEPVAPPAPPITGAVEIAGKKAIGVGESTKAVLLGVDTTDKTVTYQATDETKEFVEISADGTVKGKAPGVAEIVALIGDEVVEGIAPTKVLVLEGISKLAVGASNALRISKNEVVTIEPSYEGYDATVAVPEGIEIEETGLFSITYANDKDASKVKLALGADGKYTVTGLAKTGKTPASFTLTAYNGQSVPFTVEVLGTANKGFTLSVANSTLYMAEGDTQSFNATYTPSTTVANLSWSVKDEDGEDANNVFTLTQNTAKDANPNCSIKVNEGAAAGAYTVTASAEGYDGIATQSFTVQVQEKAEDATLKAMWKKVGSGNDQLMDAASIELYKGEKAQIVVVDSANDNAPVAGVVALSNATPKKKYLTLDSNVIVAKSTGSGASVSVTLDGKAVGTLSVTAKKAPTGLNLAVNGDTKATSLTVGVNEKFTLVMTAKNMSGSDWYSVVPSKVVGLTPATNEEDTAIADTYTCAQEGVEAITVQTTWGATKTVQLTVKGEATGVTLPADMTLVPGSTMRVKASFGSDDETEAYANLAWTVNGTEVAKTTNTNIGGKALKAKKISNSEIELTTTKAATGPIAVSAKATGYDGAEMTGETSIEVSSAPTVPEGAAVEFAKHVIGKGEKIQATITANEELEYNFASNLTWKSSMTKVATVSKTGEVTAKKAGSTQITATLNGTPVGEPQTIYVIEAAKITTNIWPKTMAEGETMTVLVKIDGYNDKSTGVPTGDGNEQYQIITKGLLSATSSSDLIQVVSFDAVANEDEIEGSETTYALVLKAKDDVSKDAKGKYPKATVTIDLSYKKNVKKQSIQVIEPPMVTEEEIEVYFPETINLAVNKKQTMDLKPFLGDATNATVNFSWKLEELDEDEYPGANSKAVKAEMSIANGKLSTTKKVPAGQVKLTGTAKIGEAERTIESLVTVGPAVTNKSQFQAVLPKAKAGLSEKIQAIVKYTSANIGGVAKWTSSNKNIATIDSATGMITTKKAGKVTFSLKVNGKGTQKVQLEVVANESDQITLTPSEKNVKAGEEVSFTVGLPGYQGEMVQTAEYKKYESAYKLAVVEGESLVADDEHLYEGKLTITSAAEASGKIVIRATSMTGKIAETVLSLGEVTGGEGGGDQPVQPEIDKTPASIELRMNGYALKSTDVLSLTEGDERDIEAIVRNKDGFVIDKPEVKFDTLDKTGAKDAKHVTVDENGHLKAVLYTTNPDTYPLHDQITVSVTAGTLAPATFQVEVNAKLDAEHIKLTNAKESMVEGETISGIQVTVDAPFEIKSSAQIVSIESSDANTLSVTNLSTTLPADEPSFDIKANKFGTAQIIVKVRGDDAETMIEKAFDVEIIAKPTKEQINLNNHTISSEKGVVMTEGEVFELTIDIDNFEGEKSAENFDVAVAAVKTDTDFAGAPNGLEKTEKTVAGADNTTPTPVPGVWLLSASRYGTYKVTVELYGDEKITETFTVTVKHAPKTTIEPGESVTAGKGEDVKLTYKTEIDPANKTNSHYAADYPNGLKWAIVTYPNMSDPTAVKPSLEGETTDTVTVKYSGPSADFAGDNSITVGLFCEGVDPEADAIKAVKTVKITYLSVPTLDTEGLKGLDDLDDVADGKQFVAFDTPWGKTATTATIGKGEKVTAHFEFADGYSTTSIEWKAANSNVSVTPNKDNPTVCVITGQNPTSGSKVSVTAYYVKPDGTNLKLGEVTVDVVGEATNPELVEKSGDKWIEFQYSIPISADNAKEVMVQTEAGTSATYRLFVDGKEQVATDKKNTWNLSATDKAEGTTVTIAIKDQDGKTIRQFNAKVG